MLVNTYELLKLFAEIAKGDEVAYAQFFEARKSFVFYTLCKLTSSRDIAAELSQEFFADIWNQRDKLAEVQKPDAYIFSVLRLKAINFRRNNYRLLSVSPDEPVLINLSVNNTQEHLDERQLNELLHAAQVVLSDTQRKVYLFRRQDISYEEIAATLGITVPNARKCYSLAVKRLSAYLEAVTK